MWGVVRERAVGRYKSVGCGEGEGSWKVQECGVW